MSWLEPMTKQFLLAISAACICIPACQFDWNIYKTWMFASSFHALQCLGGSCNHTLMISFKVFGISGATLRVGLLLVTLESWRTHLRLLLPLC